ncbi:MAG: hypothetical protein Q9180_005756 [Flavoplaca navasiana]
MSIHEVGADWMHINPSESRKRVQNRLSQRRHRAKVRQQAQGPSIPSDIFEIDGNLSDEYLDNPLDLTTVDDALDTSTHLPVQHGWETNNGIVASEMAQSHQLDSYRAGHSSQSGWADATRSVDQQDIMHMDYPTGPSLQAGDPSFMALPSAPLRPRTFPTEPWNRYGVSEPQWTDTTASRLPSKPPISAFSGAETSTPILEHNPRQTSTQDFQRPPSPRQEHQRTAAQRQTTVDNQEDSPSPDIEHSHLGHNNKKRSRGSCRNTGTQPLTSPSEIDLDQPLPYRNAAPRQRRHGPSSKATSSDVYAPSPLPRLHTQHSRCRCGTSDPPKNYVTRPTTPSTSISSPTSDVVNVTPHRRSSSHADLSPGHKLTLQDLVQQHMPERKEYRRSLQSSWRPKRVRKCSFTDSSVFEKPSVESELGRRQGIEKVVIVYLKDGEILE